MLTWNYPATQWDPQNQPITFMHLSLDPTIRNMQKNVAPFGFAPLLFQSMVGTQLVASTAKTPLSVRTVHAFCDFCQHHLAFAGVRSKGTSFSFSVEANIALRAVVEGSAVCFCVIRAIERRMLDVEGSANETFCLRIERSVEQRLLDAEDLRIGTLLRIVGHLNVGKSIWLRWWK